MAEYVKWRFTKMRAGVTMALFGLLAGLGIRAADQSEAGPQPVAAHNAAQKVLPPGTIIPHNSIGSAQIKEHSLLLKDFKIHQVASYSSLTGLVDKYDKISAGQLKIESTLQKVDVADIETKTDAANTFLQKADTAQNALKIDGLDSSHIVQGHGQVVTGNIAQLGMTSSTLLSVPGLFDASASAVPGVGTQLTLTNTSGQTLLVNGDDTKMTQTVVPGAQLVPAVQMGDGSVRTLIIVVKGGTQAITLNLSQFAGGSLIGQALVGAP